MTECQEVLALRLVNAAVRADKDAYQTVWRDLNILRETEIAATGKSTAYCRVLLITAGLAAGAAEQAYNGDRDAAAHFLENQIAALLDEATA
jgi:hypothetical protein